MHSFSIMYTVQHCTHTVLNVPYNRTYQRCQPGRAECGSGSGRILKYQAGPAGRPGPKEFLICQQSEQKIFDHMKYTVVNGISALPKLFEQYRNGWFWNSIEKHALCNDIAKSGMHTVQHYGGEPPTLPLMHRALSCMTDLTCILPVYSYVFSRKHYVHYRP